MKDLCILYFCFYVCTCIYCVFNIGEDGIKYKDSNLIRRMFDIVLLKI